MTKFGALPPPGFEWQIGKTAASITFVGDAEAFLETCLDAKKVDLLRQAIDKIKDGSLVLENWLTVDDYLNQLVP